MRIQLASLCLLVACSSNPLDPGAGNSAGSGTNTLLVTGTATATPNVPNSKLDTDFTTDIEVQVTLNNVVVATGTVTVKSRTGTTPLTFSPGGGPGRWSGSVANYDEVYELDITSGPDTVSGVRVDGPDIQTFSSPLAGASLDSTMPNTVSWNRATAADEARFSAGDNGGLVVADSGTYSIPPGTLHADKQTARPNTLRLTRTNHVTPAGAVGGSTLTVGVVQELDVVALPCAGC